MATIEEMQNKYFKESGINAFKAKLETSLKFYNDSRTTYPFQRQMLGFTLWIVEDKKELYYRIVELAHVLGFKLVKEVESTDQGKKEVLKIL